MSRIIDYGKKIRVNESGLVSVQDVYDFLRNSTNCLFLFGLAGLLIGFSYLQFAKKQFEGIGYVKINQVPVLESLAVNVDNADNTIARLANPTAYSDKETTACGVDSDSVSRKFLANSIRASRYGNTNSVIEIRVRGSTSQITKQCFEAIFNLIKVQQIQTYEERALRVKKELHQPLSKANEGLLEFLRTPPDSQVNLIGSVYVSPDAIYPKVVKTLGISLLAGIIAGFWFSLVGIKVIRAKENV